MRFAIILLFGCTLFLFTGCEADDVETSQNQMNDSNASAMAGEMPTDEAQSEAAVKLPTPTRCRRHLK